MAMWLDQHQGCHINKLPCNLKYKCCQILTEALKEIRCFSLREKKKKKELPTQPNVSKVIKTTKSSNLSSKIDVPSA